MKILNFPQKERGGGERCSLSTYFVLSEAVVVDLMLNIPQITKGLVCGKDSPMGSGNEITFKENVGKSVI